MKTRSATAVLLSMTAVLAGCSDNTGSTGKTATPVRNYYAQDAVSQVRIVTYDGMGDSIGSCMATYVSGDIVAAPLSLIRGAYAAKASTLTEPDKYPIYGFTALDFKSDIVLLRIGKRHSDFAKVETAATTPSDTIFGVDANYDGKIFKKTVKSSCVDGLQPGAGVFDNHGRLRMVASADGNFATGAELDSLVQRQTTKHASVYDLRLHTGRTYMSYKDIAGFKVRTSMGDFTIRLYDDVPQYRDNFIKLVSDHYYDSLLIHRVLPAFLIQTGAADSKYAKPGDMVGWQGPGYTLPNIDHQRHFHKRGAIAASKLPRDRNPENKCDGGQFYAVSGRVFTEAELDKIAREEHITFTSEQRKAYTTTGGAPHLDGEFVVFGEVAQGMDVVDKISRVQLGGDKGDRPVKDIRVWSISIIKK